MHYITCRYITMNLQYRASTINEHTAYLTKRTGYLKTRYSQVFSLSEHNKYTKLHSQCRKN